VTWYVQAAERAADVGRQQQTCATQ
jgi:hypothetical protein